VALLPPFNGDIGAERSPLGVQEEGLFVADQVTVAD